MYPRLFNLCRRFFKDEHDIISSINNGMLKVFKQIKSYDPSRGELFNWIYTIVRNEALSYLKSKRNHSKLIIDEDQCVITSENPFDKFEWSETFQLLDKLPPMTRAVCNLFYFEDFEIKEIAKTLNIKDGTVKWHLNESRNKLRSIINKTVNIARYGS